MTTYIESTFEPESLDPVHFSITAPLTIVLGNSFELGIWAHTTNSGKRCWRVHASYFSDPMNYKYDRKDDFSLNRELVSL
jgi:hypothetical protein